MLVFPDDFSDEVEIEVMDKGYVNISYVRDGKTGELEIFERIRFIQDVDRIIEYQHYYELVSDAVVTDLSLSRENIEKILGMYCKAWELR